MKNSSTITLALDKDNARMLLELAGGEEQVNAYLSKLIPLLYQWNIATQRIIGSEQLLLEMHELIDRLQMSELPDEKWKTYLEYLLAADSQRRTNDSNKTPDDQEAGLIYH